MTDNSKGDILRSDDRRSRQPSCFAHWKMLSARALMGLALAPLIYASSFSATAQSHSPATIEQTQPSIPETQDSATPSAPSQADQKAPGVINGTVTDKEGALAVGAKIVLTVDGQTAAHETLSGDNGDFSFANVPAGTFHLTVSAPGFDTQKYSGTLNSGQALIVAPIRLAVTVTVTEVVVRGRRKRSRKSRSRKSYSNACSGLFRIST